MATQEQIDVVKVNTLESQYPKFTDTEIQSTDTKLIHQSTFNYSGRIAFHYEYSTYISILYTNVHLIFLSANTICTAKNIMLLRM